MIDFKGILDAFEFVSFGSPYEHQAFLDRESGKVYWHSEFGDDMDELPDDIDDEKYVEIPHKNELDLGRKLVFVFVHQYLPEGADEVHAIFRKKGAYARYKGLLERQGMLDKWYEFEAEAQEKALRDWCEASSIEING